MYLITISHKHLVKLGIRLWDGQYSMGPALSRGSRVLWLYMHYSVVLNSRSTEQWAHEMRSLTSCILKAHEVFVSSSLAIVYQSKNSLNVQVLEFVEDDSGNSWSRIMYSACWCRLRNFVENLKVMTDITKSRIIAGFTMHLYISVKDLI